MKFKNHLLFLVIAILTVSIAACGASADQIVNPNHSNKAADLKGSVAIDGSGTVFPLMSKLAEAYMLTEQEDVSIKINRAGTRAGFEKFLVEDGTDFNGASREMKDEEIKLADELGIEVKEFKLAIDGLTFVIHPDNDWATELKKEELISIFQSEGGITKWSDINPDFPNEDIQPYGPNENHGTYEFFWDNILGKEDLVHTIDLQQEYSTLVDSISEDINGIAFFGFGYYINNKDKLQVVNVDFGSGPVEPSLDTIAVDGDYAPFTRPIFTYLNVDQAKNNPQVLDFALYMVNNVNKFAGETGFAPLLNSQIEEYVDFLESLHLAE